jgi:hypothetical protein
MAHRPCQNNEQRFPTGITIRTAAVCCMVAIALACAGCESEKDRKAREAAELQAKFQSQLKAENAATARALEDRAKEDREATSIRAVETHAESEEAFARYVRERPSMTAAEEGMATELGVARLRARMSEPDAMKFQNAHMNPTRNALCTEVNYTDSGKYVGFRRAYVTPDVIWVEPAEDDVTHRVFELNFKRMGCDQSATAPPAPP